jgi:hypothetical protein
MIHFFLLSFILVNASSLVHLTSLKTHQQGNVTLAQLHAQHVALRDVLVVTLTWCLKMKFVPQTVLMDNFMMELGVFYAMTSVKHVLEHPQLVTVVHQVTG